MRTVRTTVRSSLVVAVLGASLALSACGGSSSSNSAAGGGSSGSSGNGKKIVYITPNPVGSDSFLQLGVNGARQAAQQIGAQFKLYESTDPTSISQNVDAAIRSKPDLIVGLSFSFDDVFAAASKAHPDQQFLEVDSCPKNQPKNLTCVAFKEQEAAYVAGVEAGKVTKSGKIGVVAALDTPFIHRWVDPFFEGAKSVNPGVQGTALYVGGQNPFSDPARAKAQAQTLAGRGVDVILAAASAGNQGVFQAASASGFKAFGVDSNQCPDSKGVVIDNVLKRVDVAEAGAIKDVLSGNGGGFKVYGLKEKGVGVGAVLGGQFLTDCTVASDTAATAAAKKADQSVVAGTVTVKDPLQG
jgi:basic membrane protein A and related proteins